MRFRYILFALTALALTACNKRLAVQPVSFGVTTDSAAYEHGSTVHFAFTGNPDNVVFYSGAWGNRYGYAQRVSDTSGIDTLSFTTTNTATGNGVLSLLVSSDWDGKRTPADIQAATWTDISARAAWATSTTATYSGTIDLTDFKAAGKPIYLAFRYTAVAGAAQSKWTVSALSLVHKATGDSTYTIANLANVIPAYALATPPRTASPGWDTVNVAAGGFTWSPAVAASGTTSLSITGNANAVTAVAAESWTVAGPIDLTRVLHDVPTAIVKNITVNLTQLAPPLTYVYTLPGSYTATFVGINATSDNLDSAIRTLTIPVQ
jgi:hypothetical protein